MPVAHRLFVIVVLLSWACMPGLAWTAAKPSIAISVATWSDGSLTVKGTLKNFSADSVDIRDGTGRLLGQATATNGNFEFLKADVDRPELLCSIQAETPAASARTAVKGRMKSCAKVPECRILKPSGSITAAVGEDIVFSAKASLKDKSAKPLRMEWDFGGGALGQASNKSNQANYKRPTGPKATVHFVRDNGRYRVRFTAWDKKNNYCEDAVEVVVGTPPDSHPDFQANLATVAAMAETSRQNAPKASDNLQGNPGDKVVIPYESRSMQCGMDARLLPDLEMIYPVTASSMKAYVYEKGLQPKLLGPDQVDVRYAAATNASAPVGHAAINSTSQNWPTDALFSSAVLGKGELFDRYQRNDGLPLAEGYTSWSLIEFMNLRLKQAEPRPLLADEGPFRIAADPITDAEQGNRMPGIPAPYQENAWQKMGGYLPSENTYSTLWLPLTDIDDMGRVSPTSLFRVEAVDTSGTPLVATDLALTSGHDLHCRGCHTLGKIGANPNIQRVQTQPNGMDHIMWSEGGTTMADQEYDAVINAIMLHEFYDGVHSRPMEQRMGGDIRSDGPSGCGGSCHSEPIAQDLLNGQLGAVTAPRGTTGKGSMSNAMHRLHGSFQYNADKTDIQRDPGTGQFLCAGDPAKTHCEMDPAKSLFPVRNPKTGKILPMEENCLKCHSGEREQCYRDRMYSAGVTCYQCHGDMLAVAGLYEKPRGTPDGNTHRLEWLEQPDCGSCHIGTGNVGKNARNGFFSAGVKTLAFAEDDPSATPNPIDLFNPDQRRFAITPIVELPQPTMGEGYFAKTLKAPVFRLGKDRHGQVACAACHGAAHAVWPNRNPNANDNVTALELQGHTGHLLECNVCHTADSFAKLDDLDEGLKVSDAQKGVLGGPHNLHPVNDPYWWKAAPGDTENSNHTTSGGWHNNVAQVEGADHEDQCAACHGNDHKGTRLSKTPVDRVFDFSDAPDLAKLKEAGIKTKIVVKAGTPIGCNTCHSIRLSCTNSPNQECGKPSSKTTATTNHPPTLTSPNTIDAVIDESLTLALSATEPEGDDFSFSISDAESGVTLAADGNLFVDSIAMGSWIEEAKFNAQIAGQSFSPPLRKNLFVTLQDSKGAYASERLTVNLDCAAGQTWDLVYNRCSPIAFKKALTTTGVDAGTAWSFQVDAVSGSGDRLTYALAEPVPTGMTINATGNITWDTQSLDTAQFPLTISVSDTAGNQATYSINLTVCKAPMRWTSTASGCVGAVHITSSWPVQVGARDIYRYEVQANQDNGKPLSYSLIGAPTDMTISDLGILTFDAKGHEGESFNFDVEVNDNLGSWARQSVYFGVCSGETPVLKSDGHATTCVPGPITFTNDPPYGASANQPFSYQVAIAHSNNLPVHFQLQNAPAGMAISPDGLISWDTTGAAGTDANFSLVVSDDGDGWVKRTIVLMVCPQEMPTWDANQMMCL